MGNLRIQLQHIFDAGDRFQKRLSRRWDENANRRTLIVLIACGIVAGTTYWYAIRPPDAFPLNELVNVPSGATVSQTAELLEQQGVVRNAFAFRMAVLLVGRNQGVRAGDYMFKEPLDVFLVAQKISYGTFGLETQRIRILEGATVKEMAEIFAKRLPRFNKENFLAQTQEQEGFLFPDTYFFLPNVTEDVVILAMRQNFDTHWTNDIAPLLASSSASSTPQRDIVTMASLVEREARKSDDRRKIAGVLWNRIAKDMPLQVDVTFLYTIGKGTYQLTKTDLRSDSPYNTYVNKGLPPTPIGSPSLDSLKAAANPAKIDALFYLADRSGNTYFSKTYNQHLQKKALYVN